jgi:hypothetical protein
MIIDTAIETGTEVIFELPGKIEFKIYSRNIPVPYVKPLKCTLWKDFDGEHEDWAILRDTHQQKMDVWQVQNKACAFEKKIVARLRRIRRMVALL